MQRMINLSGEVLHAVLLFSPSEYAIHTLYQAVELHTYQTMVLRVVGSIFHGVDPLIYFSFQPVLHDWCNKGRALYSPVYGMVHIKEHLLLIGKSSPCGGSGFPLSLSEWSFTICPTLYIRK